LKTPGRIHVLRAPFAKAPDLGLAADTRQTHHQHEQVDEFRYSDSAPITALRPAERAS